MAEIRPLDVGEVLDGALNLYRRNFGLFVRMAVATMWLPIAILIYAQVRMQGLQPDQVVGLMQTHVAAFFGYVLIFVIIYAVGFLLLTAGSIHAISASYLERPTSLSESLSVAFSKVLPLIGVGFGKGMLLVVAGVVGVVMAGLVIAAAQAVAGGALGALVSIAAFGGLAWGIAYLSCGYGVTTEVVVLETLDGAFDSFGRSWMLTRGFRGKVFGLFVVCWIIVNFLPLVVQAYANSVVQSSAKALLPAMAVISALIPLALVPIIPCVFTLLYYDLRARREGFDLEHLGRQLETL
jgi:hypothetical protein